jgi:hypothetical protein
MKDDSKQGEILAGGRLNLEANQRGQITPQQKDQLQHDMKQEQQRQYQVIYVSFAVFIVVGMILVLIPSLPIPIITVPIVWGIGVALWYRYIWMQQKPIRDDLEAGEVQALIGYVDRNTTQGYHITISGVKYITHPDMYASFDETQRYTIYVLPRSKIILSSEIVIELNDTVDENSTP